jgi:DNA-binding response OmpR family regulator
MKVLVVDDNHALTDSIQGILEDEGMEVMSANDGNEGYAAYLLFKPDLVITDIQMPRVNGLEMMARIRAHNPTVKTIYIRDELYLENGDIIFFEKPFKLESLTTLVSEPAASRPKTNAFALAN